MLIARGARRVVLDLHCHILPEVDDGAASLDEALAITVRAHGQSEQKHLYIFHPGRQGDSPQWTKVGNVLEYASDFAEIHFVARASIVDDGIVFRYEFGNRSAD
jgi:hypothetical protein